MQTSHKATGENIELVQEILKLPALAIIFIPAAVFHSIIVASQSLVRSEQ